MGQYDAFGATQYVANGGTVVSNAYTSNSIAMVTLNPFTNNATLTWNWKTQFKLTATASGIPDGTGFGGGTVSVAQVWVDNGGQYPLTATVTNAYRWAFTNWSGDTDTCWYADNILTANMTQARSITGNFVRLQYLWVQYTNPCAANPYGLTNSYNTPFTLGIAAIVPSGSYTQYLAQGATVVSNETSASSDTSVTLSLTNDASLTWNWKTQYNLTMAVVPNTNWGSVSPGGSNWWDAGTSIVETASTKYGKKFTGWDSDTNECLISGNGGVTISVLMDRSRTIRAKYEEVAVGTMYKFK